MGNFKTYLDKNITYLIAQMNYTINDLAEITDVDPLDIYEFTKDNFVNPDSLGAVANYFLIRLPDLVMSDIEAENLFDPSLIPKLKEERETGRPVNRKEFLFSIRKEETKSVETEDVQE
jgi:hypothetical protein